ncbi:MAG: L,D-transpeptidase family protein [Firmicutes bacterium]|nr:L,D-transpeptidase family protein [Bacillota bacterium]
MHRFCALMVIAVVILGTAVMWQWESGIKKKELGLHTAPEIDEPGPVKEYSCDCEPEDDLTQEMLQLAAKPSLQMDIPSPSGQTEITRPAGRIDIVVDTVERTLTVFSDGKAYRKFPVAVGKPSTPSPPGQWQVVSKGEWSGGFGTRWLGLNMPWGKYGIHGTNKPWQIGGFVSGGCIRMLNHDVELIFDWIPMGTHVVIIGNPFGPLRDPRREIGPGERGPDVLAVQTRLKMLGFDPGAQDGMYEQTTIDAVKEFQKANSMSATGVVTDEVYDALGLPLFE